MNIQLIKRLKNINCPNVNVVRMRAGWLIPVLALFFINLVFFYDVLKGEHLFIERDLAVFSIPPKFFLVESIKNGEFPLWNPYNLFGQPFFATLQQALIYPLNIIFFVFPFSKAFNFSIILHIFLGGAFVFALLRDMEANEWASFIGALTFMSGGYLLSVHDLLPTLISVIWTPIIILFFRRAIKDESIKNAIFTGLLLSVSLLGGGAEAVLGCFIALFAIVILSPIISDKGILKASISLIVSVIIFLGLSAVQIIPFLELGGQSTRGGGIPYIEATIWSFAPWDIISFFITDPYGYRQGNEKYWLNQNWLKTLYIGFLPFILMIFYFIKDKKERILWFCIILVSLFFALGKYNPLHYYIYSYIPFFNKIRFPVKFLYLAILSISITAGLGMHLLMEEKKEKGTENFINITFIFAFLSALLLISLHLAHEHIESFLKIKGIDSPAYNSPAVNLYNTKRVLFYLCLFGLILKIGYRKQWNNWVVGILSVVLIGDLFGNFGYYHLIEAKEYFRPSWTVEKIASDEEHFRVLVTPKTLHESEFFASEIKFLDTTKELLSPSINLIYKIYDVRGAEVMLIRRLEALYSVFVRSSAIDSTNLAGLFNIKYVISTTPIRSKEFKLFAAHTEGLEGDYDELIEDKTIKIYKNLKFMPRAFLVDGYKILEKDEEILSAMIGKDFKPDKMVFLKEAPIWSASAKKQDEQAGRAFSLPKKKEAKIVEQKNNSMKIEVKTPEKSILVLTETFYPGWKVFVNGNEEKVYLADYAFRAVPINAGRHEVEFVYDPMSFKLGLIISLFTLGGITAAGIFFYLKKNKIQKNSEVAEYEEDRHNRMRTLG